MSIYEEINTLIENADSIRKTGDHAIRAFMTRMANELQNALNCPQGTISFVSPRVGHETNMLRMDSGAIVTLLVISLKKVNIGYHLAFFTNGDAVLMSTGNSDSYFNFPIVDEMLSNTRIATFAEMIRDELKDYLENKPCGFFPNKLLYLNSLEDVDNLTI